MRSTTRQIYRSLRGTYPRVEEVRAGLDVLTERGYVRPSDDQQTSRGRPSERWEVRQNLFGHIGHVSEREKDEKEEKKDLKMAFTTSGQYGQNGQKSICSAESVDLADINAELALAGEEGAEP